MVGAMMAFTYEQIKNGNMKKMISYMRKGNYEKAFEILKNDHFGTGRNTALKMH